MKEIFYFATLALAISASFAESENTSPNHDPKTVNNSPPPPTLPPQLLSRLMEQVASRNSDSLEITHEDADLENSETIWIGRPTNYHHGWGGGGGGGWNGGGGWGWNRPTWNRPIVRPCHGWRCGGGGWGWGK